MVENISYKEYLGLNKNYIKPFFFIYFSGGPIMYLLKKKCPPPSPTCPEGGRGVLKPLSPYPCLQVSLLAS